MQILEDAIMQGTGAGIFYLAFFILLVMQENERIKKILIYPNLILFCIFLNPFIAQYILGPVLNYGLPRLNMCFPVVFIIAYVVSIMMGKCKGVQFWIAGLGIALIIGMSYDNLNEDLKLADNLYGISPEVIEVSDILLEEKDNPLILAADPDFNWFRQYSHDINILYGENVTVSKMQGTLYHEIPHDFFVLSEYMEQEEVDWQKVCELAEQYEVDYIIINDQNHKLAGYDESSVYTHWQTVDYYSIYCMR